MDEKTLRALIEAGAVKRIRIIADGALFHAKVDTLNGSKTALTLKGTPKTWSSLDTVAKWVRSLGIGEAHIDIAKWQPGQRGLRLS